MVAEPERSEATGNPAQTFSGWVRICRMRISRAHNLAQQNERWIGEIVFFQNRIKRNIFAVMAELAIRNVEDDSVIDLAQSVFRGRNTNSASVSINFLMSHGQATRSTLIFSRVIHFML